MSTETNFTRFDNKFTEAKIMSEHVVALHTYGKSRVKNPHTKQAVSAYKIGYSGAVSRVLLALFGDRARDVSSSRATYRYIQIDPEVAVRHGYIVLRLTEAELQTVADITRGSIHSSIYLWREGHWWAFPNHRENDYHLPVSSAPSFSGVGLRATSLSGDKTSGIIVERSQHDPDKPPWWWITGDTYPHRDLFKQFRCRWSTRRKAWYFVGQTLPPAIQQIIDEQAVQNEADMPDEPKSALAPPVHELEITDIENVEPIPEAEDTTQPGIRIIQPPAIPDEGDLDAVQGALVSARQSENGTPLTRPVPSPRSGPARIGQAYVGELTGSIAGNVHCYGYAIHQETCVYLNLGGPHMAVEAIRAKLGTGETVNLTPWDGPAIELSAGEGNSGMYTDFSHNIPEARFQSTILVHDWVLHPNTGGDAVTFIIQTDDAQARARLRHHVRELVKCAVFDAWTDYLWQAGQNAMLLHPTRSGGDVKLWTVILDIEAWTRLITGGLAEEIIALQETAK